MFTTTLPTLYRHTIVSGSDYESVVPVDPAIDLTGATASSQIYDRFGGVVAQFVCSIPTPAAKRIGLVLPAIESLKLSEHRHYSHTLKILNAQQELIYVSSGDVIALRGSTDSTGGTGGDGSPETAQTKIFFSFGDASPKSIATLPVGATVFTAQIVIQTPFNGVNPALVLGDEGVDDRLIKSYQNDPTFAAEYETNPGYAYSVAASILLTITPGEGCTQGSGYILLEV